MTRFSIIALLCQLMIAISSSCQHAQPVNAAQADEFLSDTVIITDWEAAPAWSTPVYSDAQKDSIIQQYESALSQSAIVKSKLARAYRDASSQAIRDSVLEEAGQYMRQQLTEVILPAWYGTPWDFNGHINRPHSGEIACGYYVSTPLRHLGFQLNRYKVAQQAASTIVDILCKQQQRFHHVDKTLAYIRNQPDDLYLVGLDYHVGFLHKSGNRIDFIHSTYVGPSCALTEPAADSWVLQSSGLYVLGHLSSNTALIKSWLLEQQIHVE